MNIRQVRKKIKSVVNIKKITRAMELVSAVKMKKSQEKALQGRPYQETLETVIKKITSMIDPNITLLLRSSDSKKNLVILISSNKGLCGSFNFNLLRYCTKEIDIKNSDFIILGKIASFYINKFGGNIIADYSESLGDQAVSAIFQQAVEKFLEGKYGKILLAYNKFISAIKNIPTIDTILPIKLESDISKSAVTELEEKYLIEPSPEKIIDSLLKNYVREKIRSALLSSEAGEHSARMMAMKNATDNATQLIEGLTQTRNKLRQEKITYELLDMITAKESVEN